MSTLAPDRDSQSARGTVLVADWPFGRKNRPPGRLAAPDKRTVPVTGPDRRTVPVSGLPKAVSLPAIGTALLRKIMSTLRCISANFACFPGMGIVNFY